MLPEDTSRLQKYQEYTLVPLLNTDAEKWPIRSGRIGPFVLDEFSRQLSESVDGLRQKGLSLGEIGKLFGSPSRLWRLSHHYLNGMRLNQFSLAEQRRRMIELLDMIKALKSGSEFTENGKNLILSPEAVDELLDLDFSVPQSRSESALVHKLCGTLWAYVETLYFVAHEISMELHGPYNVHDGSTLIVRDYFNLSAKELWPETKDISHRSVRVFALYEGVQIEFDVYNNPYTVSGDLVNGLRSFRIEADGAPFDISSIMTLCDELTLIISSIAGKIEDWTLKQIALKYADIFWYRIKPLSDCLEADWRPPSFVNERFEHKAIPPDPTAPTPKEKILKMLDLLEEK
jgi:hypothetical protein